MGLRRGVDPVLLAEVSKPFFFPVWLLWIDWPVEPIRAHTGRGNIGFAGETWAGVGRFALISLPTEQMGLAADVATIRIIGEPANILPMLTGQIRNRLGGVWFGAVTERAGSQLIGAPTQVFSGFVDGARMVVDESVEGYNHALEIEMGTGAPARSKASHFHSDADQRAKYPTDTAGRLLQSSLARTISMRWPEN